MRIENSWSRGFPPSRAVVLFAMMVLLFCSLAGAQAVPKLGVIDVERILTDSVSGKALIQELETLGNQKRQALEQQQKEVADLQQRYAESRLTLAEDKLAEMQRQLEDKTLNLRRATDDAQRELQKKQQEEFARIEKEVMPIIQALGKELGFTLIFNKFQGGLVFADDSVDITDLVIERFDKLTTGG